jgi:uncharacterized protein (UPF0335 family)
MTVASNHDAALIRYVERVERLDEELDALQGDRKEVFAEAKAEGFNVAAIRTAVAARKNYGAYKEKRAAVDAVLDVLDAHDERVLAQSVAEAE